MDHRLIAALHKIMVGKVVEDDFSLLLDLKTSKINTTEWFMSSEGDYDWEQAQEEDDYDDREAWAKEEAEFYQDMGYPTHWYMNITRYPRIKWLAHFTDTDPKKIIQEGFKGVEFEVLGQTKHTHTQVQGGPYAFAFQADQITKSYDDDEDFGVYGKNLILFKANEAIKAFHVGDEEKQIIFVTKSVYDLHPVYGDSDKLTYKKGRKKFTCDRDKECVHKLIKTIENL